MQNIWPEYLQGIFTVHILNHTKYIVTAKCFLEYLIQLFTDALCC